jgi:hypothetical protein
MKINITKLKFTLTILGIYIPPLLLFTLILKFSVNVPHWEEWDYLVPLFIDFYKNHYLNMEYVFESCLLNISIKIAPNIFNNFESDCVKQNIINACN